MTTYRIQAPDGNTYQVEGPEGASQEQVQAEVMRQHPDLGAVQKPDQLKGTLGGNLIDNFSAGAQEAAKGVGNVIGGIQNGRVDQTYQGVANALGGGTGMLFSPISAALQGTGADYVVGPAMQGAQWALSNGIGGPLESLTGGALPRDATGELSLLGISTKTGLRAVGKAGDAVLPYAKPVLDPVVMPAYNAAKAVAKPVSNAAAKFKEHIGSIASEQAAKYVAARKLIEEQRIGQEAKAKEGDVKPKQGSVEWFNSLRQNVADAARTIASPQMWELRTPDMIGGNDSHVGVPYGTGTATGSFPLLQAEKRASQSSYTGGAQRAKEMEDAQQIAMHDMLKGLDQNKDTPPPPAQDGLENGGSNLAHQPITSGMFAAGVNSVNDAAVKAAGDARNSVRPSMLPENMSKTVYDAQHAAEQTNVDAVNKAYNEPMKQAADLGLTAPLTAADAGFQKVIEGFDPGVKRNVASSVLRAVFNGEDFAKGVISFGSLRNARNALSEIQSGANHRFSGGMEMQAAGVLKSVIDKLMEDSASAAGHPEITQALQDARKLRTEVGNVEDRQGRVASALGETATGADKVSVGKSIDHYVRPGPEGADYVRQLLNHTGNNPEVIRAVSDRILHEFQGAKNQAAVDSIKEDYGPTLRLPQFNELGSKIDAYSQALNASEAITEGRIGALAGKDVKHMTNSVLESDNPSQVITDLEANFGKHSNSWKGFMQALLENVTDRVKKGSLRNSEGDHTLSVGDRSIGKLEAMASNVERVHPAFAKVLRVIASIQEKMSERNHANTGGQSPTGFLSGTLFDGLISHASRHSVAAGAGYLLGNVGGAMAGTVLSGLSDVRVGKALSQMLFDPKMAKHWMTKASEGNWSMLPKEVKQKMMAIGFHPWMMEGYRSVARAQTAKNNNNQENK